MTQQKAKVINIKDKELSFYRCNNSPDGLHLPQNSKTNSVPACKYCGKLV